MGFKIKDYLYFALPAILWPLTFIVFRAEFVYAMTVSTAILATFTLWKYRKYVSWLKTRTATGALAAGAAISVLLYLIFFAGYYFTAAIGLGGSVANVYTMLYSQHDGVALVLLLAVIGIFEEIYWRGGVQGIARKESKLFKKFPWLLSTAYYTLVHFATLNPVLVLAAFAVGLVTSLTADRYGIVASTVTHILWIEAIVVFLPVL